MNDALFVTKRLSRSEDSRRKRASVSVSMFANAALKKDHHNGQKKRNIDVLMGDPIRQNGTKLMSTFTSVSCSLLYKSVV